MKLIKVSNGYDVPLAGAPSKEVGEVAKPATVALKPADFLGLKPRLLQKEGEKVKLGQALLEWKDYPQVKFASPGAGAISRISYGARRKLLEIVIDLDDNEGKESVTPLKAEDIPNTPSEELIEKLCAGGMWPLLIKRPFGKIASPDVKPNAVFINAMNTSPASPDPMFAVKDRLELVKVGLDALMQMSKAQMYLNLHEDADIQALRSVGIGERPHRLDITRFAGAHPAGLAGTHMRYLRPLRPKEVFWTLSIEDLALIGEYLTTGVYPVERTVALCGPAAANPMYLKTRLGAPVAAVAGIQVKSGEVRYISGSPLDGTHVTADGFVGFYDTQLTVLEEGRKKELFGWLMPGFSKLSRTGVFVSSLLPFKREWKLDTNLHGARRPFILDDIYDEVMGTDVMPSELMKAIMAEDFEDMERQGLLDCIEEDVALCTYICPSKIPFGDILREGLNLYEKEG